MKRVLKWIGVILLGLIGILIVAVVVSQVIANSRANETYEIDVETISIPDDAAAIARGEHLAAAITGCNGCHGEIYAGTDFLDDPALGKINAANLTAGNGGIGAAYTDKDWIRTLRYGVGPDLKPLIVMPSQNYRYMSDQDLGSLIAFIKTTTPVDQEWSEPKLSLMGNVLFAANALGKLAAETIQERGPAPAAPAEAVTVEYGSYLVRIAGCRDCHSENLAGGSPAPGEPFASNLTPGGELADWAESDFMTLLRAGVTADGVAIGSSMPWEEHYQFLTDEEIQAMWAYLQTVEALPDN